MREPSSVTVLVVGLLIGLTSCARPRPVVDPARSPDPILRIELPTGDRVVELAIETYVAGAIPAEADFRGLTDDEAQRVARVQAILARTYALSNRDRHAADGFDLCGTTHCQVYQPSSETAPGLAALSESAARATAGLVIVHDGQPINAVFHAHCGGHTSDAQVAWGGATPAYLQGVDDEFCLWDDPPPWRFEVDHAALLEALNADPLTYVGSYVDSVHPIVRDAGGRVARVSIRGAQVAEVRAEQLRRVLVKRFGPRSLKSTRFSITRMGDQFLFEGQGFGHGIGLCQRGAAARVRAGHTPAEILAHYYPGTSLTRYH